MGDAYVHIHIHTYIYVCVCVYVHYPATDVELLCLERREKSAHQSTCATPRVVGQTTYRLNDALRYFRYGNAKILVNMILDSIWACRRDHGIIVVQQMQSQMGNSDILPPANFDFTQIEESLGVSDDLGLYYLPGRPGLRQSY